jgi:hypothetical protein
MAFEFWPIHSEIGVFEARLVPEGASVTATAGQTGYIDANGYALEGSDGFDYLTGVFAEDCHNDSSAGTHNVLMWIGNPWTEFEATSYAVLAQTNLGELADLDVTSGVHTVHNGTNADNIFRITKLIGTIGATGKLWVKFVRGEHAEDEDSA